MARIPSVATAGPSRIALVCLASTALALTACNRADRDRTTQAPPGVAQPTALVAPIVTPSAPPAPAERSAVAPDANAAAPGTDARTALADAGQDRPLPPSKGGPPERQEANVRAQEAAAQAPDTASADAAKKRVLDASAPAQGADPVAPATARDTPANQPRHGALTAGEESNAMPKAGQVNNHSSPALEADSGRKSE
ncbi:MAG: hypothetical protein U1F48_08175 [Burkholderiales bacterium]